MVIKRSGSTIFGAELTAKERKALDIEIRKECAAAIDKMERQVDILMLWQLHTQEGFGKKRLERFYRQFAPAYNELRRYYQTDDSAGDGFWIMERQFKEIGVSVDELAMEFSGEGDGI